LPTSVRNLKNKEIKSGRAAAQAEVDRRIINRELHPDTRKTFRALANKVHPADQGRLMMAIDDRLNGSTTAQTWREARKMLGIDPSRPSTSAPTPPPAMTPAKVEIVELWKSSGS
jgi:hypothetical protein